MTNRLYVIVGKFGSGKTELLKELAATFQYPYINVNLELGRRLIGGSSISLALKAKRALADLVDSFQAEIILLDNIEILFEPEVGVDALDLFNSLARNKTLVVAWPGKYERNVLSYGEPDRKDYYSKQAAIEHYSL